MEVTFTIIIMVPNSARWQVTSLALVTSWRPKCCLNRGVLWYWLTWHCGGQCICPVSPRGGGGICHGGWCICPVSVGEWYICPVSWGMVYLSCIGGGGGGGGRYLSCVMSMVYLSCVSGEMVYLSCVMEDGVFVLCHGGWPICPVSWE